MMQSKERIYQRLEGSLDMIRNEMERVEIWASALHGFNTPVPDYQPDERYMLPTSRDSGQTLKTVKRADEC
jgi:hypothetical protein